MGKLRTRSKTNNKNDFVVVVFLFWFGFGGQVPLKRLQYSVLNTKNLRLLKEVLEKRNLGWSCKRQQITNTILKRPYHRHWSMLKSGNGGKKIEFQRSSSFHKYIHGIWAKFLTSHYAMPLEMWTNKPLRLIKFTYSMITWVNTICW